MSDNYKDHPKSITEIKANKERDGSLWTPRDALINILRDIDEGRKIDNLVICFSEEIDYDNKYTQYASSCKDYYTQIGLITAVLAVMTRKKS